MQYYKSIYKYRLQISFLQYKLLPVSPNLNEVKDVERYFWVEVILNEYLQIFSKINWKFPYTSFQNYNRSYTILYCTVIDHKLLIVSLNMHEVLGNRNNKQIVCPCTPSMCKVHPKTRCGGDLRQGISGIYLRLGIRGFGVDSLESGLSKFHVIAAGKHLFIFTAGRFPFSFFHFHFRN